MSDDLGRRPIFLLFSTASHDLQRSIYQPGRSALRWVTFLYDGPAEKVRPQFVSLRQLGRQPSILCARLWAIKPSIRSYF
jgi:hypothetical protein